MARRDRETEYLWRTMVSWSVFCNEGRWLEFDDYRREIEKRESKARRREKAADEVQGMFDDLFASLWR